MGQRIVLGVVEPDRAHVEPDMAYGFRVGGPGAAADAVGGFQDDGAFSGFRQGATRRQAGDAGADDDAVEIGHAGSLWRRAGLCGDRLG